MGYRILAGDRKDVKAKLEELSGERALYTRMPRCAYIIRGIALEKNGEVTTEEGADMELVGKLIEAGLISGETEPAEVPQEETDTHSDEPQTVKPEISFPLEAHRPESIINLVNTVFSKGTLISKSTGGTFSASEELVSELQEGHFFQTGDLARAIDGDGGLAGISFGDGRVTFDGFPETADPDSVKAWTALAAAVNSACISQKHVRAKRTDETNEKFAFRTWLTRLGMNGPEMKQERAILYRNLSGHTAFRTEEDGKKWKARMAQKRQEQRGRTEDNGAEE